jgi:UDP-N-acetylglucosamine 2-epimerase (non-hydrolysing)
MTKLKVTTIVGTRPEIIRMSEIIKKFDTFFEHRLIHTGQNPDPLLKDIFFKDLELRDPDLYFGGDHTSLGGFLSNLFVCMEKEFTSYRPDAVVILGDTNSALSAILAKRLGIPVYHLEAGNRSFDQNVPEEINRKIVDHTADFNLVYTELARNNLITEGLHPRKIALIGSPLNEVLQVHKEKINNSKVLSDLKLKKNEYILVSAHRQENIDYKFRFDSFISTLEQVSKFYKYPILVSTHPRTKKQIDINGISKDLNISFHEPFNFTDYNHLQKNAFIVLSDSGTISEESAMLGFKAVTIRDSMERPEALEAGSIVMSGTKPKNVIQAIDVLLKLEVLPSIPAEYLISDTSTRVINFIISTVHQYKFWNSLYSDA